MPLLDPESPGTLPSASPAVLHSCPFRHWPARALDDFEAQRELSKLSGVERGTGRILSRHGHVGTLRSVSMRSAFDTAYVLLLTRLWIALEDICRPYPCMLDDDRSKQSSTLVELVRLEVALLEDWMQEPAARSLLAPAERL